MWETDWTTTVKSHDGGITVPMESVVKVNDVESVYLLHWREHCVECAPPDCYRTCRLYVKRRDQKCARFKNGITPNNNYQGLYGYGAEIRFRRWGKLESTLNFGAATPRLALRLANSDAKLQSVVNVFAAALERVDPHRRLNGGYAVLRNIGLQKWSRIDNESFHEFVIEAFNPSGHAYDLTLEIFQNGPRFRTLLPIRPGHNLHRIPASMMNLDLNAREGRISIRPDKDFEAHIIFTWLDFVRYRKSARPADVQPVSVGSPNSETAASAEKVKCVVWDLDNTLWRGILVEDGVEGIQLRPEALDLIQKLDERGIVQSIASKNDHEAAISALHAFGVKDYFLFPVINWGPKSEGIKAIAADLNLGLDSFAFIDDSPVERKQVKETIPQVRVYAESEIAELGGYPELTVPVTTESRQRRLSYLEESQRKVVAAHFAGDIEAFLRSCNLQAQVFTPHTRAHFERCLELLHRSNQLNLTTHRYTEEQLGSLLDDPGHLCVATACRDRFGDYGIVSFAAFDLRGTVPLLIDFVFSCRVANKKVENAWFRWVAELLRSRSFSSLQAVFIPTKKNGVLLEVLRDAGFRQIGGTPDALRLELPFDAAVPASDIVTIIDTGIRTPAKSPECSVLT